MAEASHSGQTIAVLAARTKPSEAPGHAFGDGGDNDGSGGSFVSPPPLLIKDYFDAREQAIELRFCGHLDGVPSRETAWNISIVALGGIITLLTLFMGVIAFGGDRFDSSLSLSSAMPQLQLEQQDIDAAQNTRLDHIDGRLDRIEGKLDLLLEYRSADRG